MQHHEDHRRKDTLKMVGRTLQQEHYNGQVCVRQMGEEEKWSSLTVMKRVGTGDTMAERSSLL